MQYYLNNLTSLLIQHNFLFLVSLCCTPALVPEFRWAPHLLFVVILLTRDTITRAALAPPQMQPQTYSINKTKSACFLLLYSFTSQSQQSADSLLLYSQSLYAIFYPTHEVIYKHDSACIHG